MKMGSWCGVGYCGVGGGMGCGGDWWKDGCGGVRGGCRMWKRVGWDGLLWSWGIFL